LHIYAADLLRAGAIRLSDKSRYLSLNASDISLKIFDVLRIYAPGLLRTGAIISYTRSADGQTDTPSR
jgi:hypothetical protein